MCLHSSRVVTATQTPFCSVELQYKQTHLRNCFFLCLCWALLLFISHSHIVAILKWNGLNYLRRRELDCLKGFDVKTLGFLTIVNCLVLSI